MANQNYVYITLDTTAPANPTVTISGGALAVANALVDLAISVDDADKTGYQMLIWGDVDETYDANVQKLEANAKWFAFSPNPQVKLDSVADGTKTINVRVRDAVNNPSNVAIDTVNLDATVPTITVTYTAMTISEQPNKDTFSFTFQSSDDFVEYKVKLVGTTGDAQDQGQQIPTTNGSTNVAETGSFLSSTVKTVTLKAQDLRLAGANMNGQNIVKVFVKNQAQVWSA